MCRLEGDRFFIQKREGMFWGDLFGFLVSSYFSGVVIS